MFKKKRNSSAEKYNWDLNKFFNNWAFDFKKHYCTPNGHEIGNLIRIGKYSHFLFTWAYK